MILFERKKGDALCPERYDKETLLQIAKDIGTVIFTGLYQQRPAPQEGSILKIKWFKTFNRLPYTKAYYQSWDTAFKDEDGLAYSCGQTWAECEQGYYLVDVFRDRLEYPELIKIIKARYDKYKPRAVLIEDKASGQSAVQSIRREVAKIPLIAINPSGKGDKVIRAKLISPLIEAGFVFIPESSNAAWLSDFIDEIIHFPNTKYADQIDAMTQMLDYFQTKKGSVISGAEILTGGRH